MVLALETKKLYYEDPYLREFPATVLSCEPAGEAWKVVLDQTAFYPEGGGQPADHGVLRAAGREIPVTDVHEKNGAVIHTCAAPVEPGAVAAGALDWARRFDHMQQHSGEHIISGVLCRLYHCDNVGFHLGAETVTIDYNTDISWEQALEAERLANEAVWADRETEITYPSPAELAALDYRSKKELAGQVRIVEFPEADRCACCGTHVASAGQVGLVKVLSCQKFREGVRMEILCGARALRYLSGAYDQARAIGQRLSVKAPGDPGGGGAPGGGAGRREGARRGAGTDRLCRHRGGTGGEGGRGTVPVAHAPGQPPPSGGRRGKVLRRAGGGVLRGGGEVELRPGPGRRGGHLFPGEGAEPGPSRPGRRPERLCPGQRRGGPGGN